MVPAQLILKGAQDPFDMYRDGFRPEDCTIPIVQTPFILYDRSAGPGHPAVVRPRSIRVPKVCTTLIYAGEDSIAFDWEDLVAEMYAALIRMDVVYPFELRHFRPTQVSQKPFLNPLPGEIEVVQDLFARATALLNASRGVFAEEKEWFIHSLLSDAARCPHGFFHPQEAIYHLILLYEYILEAF